jgi:hypothetical protein
MGLGIHLQPEPITPQQANQLYQQRILTSPRFNPEHGGKQPSIGLVVPSDEGRVIEALQQAQYQLNRRHQALTSGQTVLYAPNLPLVEADFIRDELNQSLSAGSVQISTEQITDVPGSVFVLERSHT